MTLEEKEDYSRETRGQKKHFRQTGVIYSPDEMFNRTEALLDTAGGQELLHCHGVTQEHSHQLVGKVSTPAFAFASASASAFASALSHALASDSVSTSASAFAPFNA